MHSAFISILALAFVIASAIGLDSSRSTEVFLLAILVALVGVPHGALDHLVGQRLLRPAFGSFWGLTFFSVYLAISVVIVIGWHEMPAVTILTFFLVSAWHFGLEERDVDSAGLLRHLLAIASGGLIIWMPALFRGDEVVELLELITPRDQGTPIAFCVSAVAASAVPLAPLCVFDCIRNDLRSSRSDRGWIQSIWSSNCLRMLSIAVFCCSVNPLVSFTVYFCGWHSVRGLHQLARSLGESVVATYRKLLPLTVTALALVSAGSFFWSSTGAIETSLIRTVFLGLSALAVPHLCLHVVAGSLSQRFTNPSTAHRDVFNHANDKYRQRCQRRSCVWALLSARVLARRSPAGRGLANQRECESGRQPVACTGRSALRDWNRGLAIPSLLVQDRDTDCGGPLSRNWRDNSSQ